jgi:hypothetical protein
MIVYLRIKLLMMESRFLKKVPKFVKKTEGRGFEPPVELPLRRFSNSTAE